MFVRLNFSDISGNPWNCGCNMKWLVSIIQSKRSGLTVKMPPKCYSPVNVLMGNLNLTSVACGQYIRSKAFCFICACYDKICLRDFRPDSDRAAQLQKIRGSKFRIKEIDGLYYLYRENKGADQVSGYRSADLCPFSYMQKEGFSPDAIHPITDFRFKTRTKTPKRQL